MAGVPVPDHWPSLPDPDGAAERGGSGRYPVGLVVSVAYFTVALAINIAFYSVLPLWVLSRLLP